MKRLPLWAAPILSVLLIAGWQWATVTANYGGNWTALFCTGAIQRHPPLASQEHIYLFAGSRGFDGQFYHWIAHDPFLRSGMKAYVDDPVLRYRRILVPLLAYTAAFGYSAWIDPAYELVFLCCVALGVYWSCLSAQRAALAAAWGLLFLLMPAVPISADRLVVDVALAALTAGFVCYVESSSWKLFAVVACAPLARETGFLLIGATVLSLILKREYRRASLFLTSLIPALAWYGYVRARTTGPSFAPSLKPLASIFEAAVTPWTYPAWMPFPDAVRAADYLALAGVLLAFGLAGFAFARRPCHPLIILAAIFALFGIATKVEGLWTTVYNFGRVYTPLLVCLAGLAAEIRNVWLLLPLALILPRIAIQLAPQLLGVIHRLM